MVARWETPLEELSLPDLQRLLSTAEGVREMTMSRRTGEALMGVVNSSAAAAVFAPPPQYVNHVLPYFGGGGVVRGVGGGGVLKSHDRGRFD
ncbi:hypothetical protein QJS10_CPB20g00800 [Acorus calamus]|uniref:Uncharacterized protein n=1 Tax=Acorus calamus TaxID=4465 RepID=A0AAV9CBW8_ACOCL|nr:hypothetical protein QJS10_CPB20g00803 [Acorus calamus]KAK1286199.1 hypothetical protein QJS10_CPB20g00800 [Acorus calamus]